MGLYAYLLFRDGDEPIGLDAGGEKEMVDVVHDYGEQVDKRYYRYISAEECEEDFESIQWVTVRELNEFFTKIQGKMKDKEEQDLIGIVEEYKEILDDHSPKEKVTISIG